TYSLVSMSDATCSGIVSGSATVNIIVAPTVTLAAFSAICTNAGMQTLTGGSPAGGVYSGLGVSNGVFDPAVGTSTITYTVTFGSGCTKSASRILTVGTAPVVTLNTFASVCSTAPAFTLTGGMPGGGTYSGTGVTGSATFTPSVAGVGVKIITYTVNSGGCSGSDTASITVNNCGGCPNPPTSNAGVDKNTCGSGGVAITGSIGGAATNSTWSSAGSGAFTPNTTALNVTYTPSAADLTAGSVKIYLTTNDPDGAGACVAAKDSMIINFLPAPTAGAITGNSNFCRNTSGNIYSIPAQAGVTFNWTAPTGATITGQGSNSISIAFSNTAATGNVCVTPTNSCGSGAQVCKAITVRTTVPGTPGAITGSTIGCPGESKVYSVALIAAANQYLWTPPAGATINGSSTAFLTTSNSVTVAFGAGFTGDTLKVRTVNCIGQSNTARVLRINKTAPGTPGTITGQAVGLCNINGVTYSIAAVTNATSYTWRTTVAGSTINGSTSPVTTSNLSVSANYGVVSTGNIYVKSNNGCGSSAERTLALVGRPAVPTSITGPAVVCKSQIGVAYSTTSVPFATSYGWTVPSGASITSGATTTNILVNFGPTAATGTVKARATNACGSSSYFNLNVTMNTCPKINSDGSIDQLFMEAYPNPVHDLLHVTLLSPATNSFNLMITDVMGRTIQQEVVEASVGENKLTVNAHGLAAGTYVLSLSSTSGIVQQRFVVE
ncbi:MAG: T9SS type A sorting domain-containing protein, partial [Bacteroidota bacterium]